MPTAEEILALRDRSGLFPGVTPAERKAAYRALLMAFHPDTGPGTPEAARAFDHVQAMWKRVNAASTRRLLRLANGRQLAFTSFEALPAEEGELLLGARSFLWVLEAGFADLADGLDARTAFRFANTAMERQFSRQLPVLLRTDRLMDGGAAIVVARRPGSIRLAELIARKGPLAPVHVAWLVSSLMNLSVYFDWAGIVHGGIVAQNVFVDPATHEAQLLGGWWYATTPGRRYRALLASVAQIVTARGDGSVAATAIDRVAIRRLAIALLGAAGVSGLAATSGLPGPVAAWLALPPADDAVEDYRSWEKARGALGPRKFVRLPVSAADIHPTTNEGE